MCGLFLDSNSWNLPTLSWYMYLPASHGEHDPFMGPVPPSQEQSATTVLPACEVNGVGQAVQEPGPISGLNVPGGQDVHSTPPGPVYPGLHWQAPTPTLSGGDTEFAGHNAHAEDHTSTSQRIRY